MATKESENPDLRDRGFIYWRLLSADPEAAKVRGIMQAKALIVSLTTNTPITTTNRHSKSCWARSLSFRMTVPLLMWHCSMS